MFKLFTRKDRNLAPTTMTAAQPPEKAAQAVAPTSHDDTGSTGSGGEGLHVPYGKLPRTTLHGHYAITSMREELEAADWYRQRAADTEDPALRAIFLHNAKEEIEHFAMLLEWMRRQDGEFDHELKEYLFSEGPITEVEQKAMGKS